MTNLIAANDPRLKWAGAVSVEAGDGWVMPWRLPHEDRGLYAEELVVRAAHPSGVRLVFRSDTSSVEVFCEPVAERTPVELVVDGRVVGSADTADRSDFRFDVPSVIPADVADPARARRIGTGIHVASSTPAGATPASGGMKLIELWLPLFGEFRFRGMKLDEGAALEPAPAGARRPSIHSAGSGERASGWRRAPGNGNPPRWITYGSSITQCRTAELPTLSWPARVARARGYDLTSLGFGGQCHLDSMVARVIRDSDADLISLCLGINIYGAASLGPRTFGPGIAGFVQVIREKHPTAVPSPLRERARVREKSGWPAALANTPANHSETPIVLISPIFSPDREDTPNAVGFTLRAMRDEVRGAFERLRAHGDGNVYYIDGLDVLGSDSAHLLPDDLHPNAEGYGLMAERLLGLLPRV